MSFKGDDRLSSNLTRGNIFFKNSSSLLIFPYVVHSSFFDILDAQCYVCNRVNRHNIVLCFSLCNIINTYCVLTHLCRYSCLIWLCVFVLGYYIAGTHKEIFNYLQTKSLDFVMKVLSFTVSKKNI